MVTLVSPVHRLIYASRTRLDAAGDMTVLLAEIRAQSLTANRRRGVASLLVAHRGWFVQAFEGEEAFVRATFARIAADPRHEAPEVLVEEGETTRLLGDWSLATRVLSKADTAVLMAADPPDSFAPHLASARTWRRLIAVLGKAHARQFEEQQRQLAEA